MIDNLFVCIHDRTSQNLFLSLNRVAKYSDFFRQKGRCDHEKNEVNDPVFGFYVVLFLCDCLLGR